MDTLNDYYPLYPPNPETCSLSESEISENLQHLTELERINERKKRKRAMVYDDFMLKYSDDLWYLWCIIREFTDTNYSTLLDRMDYPSFCNMCYENSTKY
jgi:hypothetical protein